MNRASLVPGDRLRGWTHDTGPGFKWLERCSKFLLENTKARELPPPSCPPFGAGQPECGADTVEGKAKTQTELN